MALNQVSFTSPGYDYGADMAQIERRRALANALQSQSMQPIETPPVGPGQFATPISPWQGAAKLMQAYAAKRQGDRADEQQRALAAKSQSDYQQMVARGLRQLQGTPATAISEDASGNVTPAQPAVAPDAAGAMATFGSHPMGQPLQGLAMQEMQRQRLIEALRGGHQAQQPNAAAGGSAPAYGSPGFQPMGGPQQPPQGTGLGGPAKGIPLETWLAVDPTGKSYLSNMASGSETSGRPVVGQDGRMWSQAKNGQMIPMMDERGNQLRARDKMEMVQAGDRTVPVNPFTQTEPIPRGISPEDQARGRWEGWLPPTSAPQPGQPGIRVTPQGTTRTLESPPTPSAAPSPLNVPPKDRAKLELDRPQSQFAVTSVLDGLGRATAQIDKLLQSPGLSNVTGPVAGRTPNFTGSATNAQSLIDSLKSMISVQELQRMRDASKTGGAVGNVTEKEWPRLEAQLGALQQAQTTEEFTKNLREVRSTMQRMQDNARRAYETTYGKLDYRRQGSDDDPLGLRK